MNTQVKFNNVNALFSKSLKLKINQYFQQDLIKKSGNRKLILKAIILSSSLVLIYSILIFLQPHWIISVLLCILLGVNFAGFGFNIMHCDLHNSFSYNEKFTMLF